MKEMRDDEPHPKVVRRVGLVCNTKSRVQAGNNNLPRDEEAEYDSQATVDKIADTIRLGGYECIILEADDSFYKKATDSNIQIAFNIAEGLHGRGREAQVPTILDILGIPYTGSDPTALCVALDKAMCKRLMESYGVRTPGHIVTDTPDIDYEALKYPVIIKPNAEGSSKGVPDACVAVNKAELKNMLQSDLSSYKEQMLIEEYIDGREFTVGLLGNGSDLHVFEPMEIQFRKDAYLKYDVYSYDVKQDYKKFISYQCPANISEQQSKEMKSMAEQVFNGLGCNDFARADFRMDREGNIYFIEINPLPGLAYGYSDYPMLAEFCGVSYQELVLSVLHAGIRRLGLEDIR